MISNKTCEASKQKRELIHRKVVSILGREPRIGDVEILREHFTCYPTTYGQWWRKMNGNPYYEANIGPRGGTYIIRFRQQA